MIITRARRTGFASSLAMAAFLASAAVAQESGRDATRSVVTTIDVDGTSRRVAFESARRFDAPNWSPDGSYLLLNSGGRLWKVPAEGGKEPQLVPTLAAGHIDINHGISPDGKALAVTVGAAMFLLPAEGGNPRRLAVDAPSYFHAWSPDGKALGYTANRGRGYEIFGLEVAGGHERRLAPGNGFSDSPAYSADGRWIYFNSDRSGTSALWRVATSPTGKAERVLADDRENWAPRPSPDGKWLLFLSYPRKTAGQPSDRDVAIRRLPLPGDQVGPAKPEDVVRLVGGFGSIGAGPWSPDGRRFAYVSYEPPPPSIRVVFFTPSDLDVPAGAAARLTNIADSAERFLREGMKDRGYPAAVDALFRREADGSVEILQVKGDQPVASGKYANPDYAADVIRRATGQSQVAGEGHVWWIFIYLGDRPTRFEDWRGMGCSRDGGWAMVNYDTIPGEIRPDLGLETGFNSKYYLKGTIHELGHALGLHHVGPDLALGLGNTLMGPNNDVYAARGYAKADRVYLSDSEAARLWKHPIFSGTNKDRVLQPIVKLADYKARYSRAEDRVTVSGKLIADRPVHSVVVMDDRGKPDDHYWFRGHAARLAPDGAFRVEVEKPAKADGHFRILFCFENGMVTGDGAGVVFDDSGEIRKSYRYRDGTYQFGD